ncbi:hypothetical protein [Dyadobacter sp. 676]|uniref:Alkaline phosphatase family protein n=1 Tax=Dyadobacter sp. 676 TaxID=3088362 RepID=A0AAU8FRL4_9BACT
MDNQASVVGLVNYQSELDFKAWLSMPVTTPEYGRMVPSGAKIHLIAVGGGLTAGVQNGGLSRQGQLSAYPNLVAKQLGMADFVTPAFSETEANGTGFLIPDPDDVSPFPKFRRVTNNLAPVRNEHAGYPPMLSAYNGRVHNFSAPGLSLDGILNNTWAPWMIDKVVSLNSGKSWASYMPYLWRFTPQDRYAESTLADLITEKSEFNFFLLEGMHERFLHVLKSRAQIGLSDLIGDLETGTDVGLRGIKLLTKGGAKGVIFTIPHFQDLAAYNWYTPDYIRHNASAIDLSIALPSGGIQKIDPAEPFWLLPSPAVDAAYRKFEKGGVFAGTFDDIDALSRTELIQYTTAVNIYNSKIKKWALEYDLALVDLEDIYHKVHLGQYKTTAGLIIDGGRDGNFFSWDGIYPSTLGHAVIANEVLRAIAEKYSAHVPAIDVDEYAKTIHLTLNR